MKSKMQKRKLRSKTGLLNTVQANMRWLDADYPDGCDPAVRIAF